MKRSTDRILTTHVGSLPRPADLMALYADNASDDKLQPRLRSAIGDIVRRQAESGIDVVNDGEFGKAMRSAMDFGAWWSYVYPRLQGFELRDEQAKKGRAAWTFGSKERKEFAEFYAAEASAAASAAKQSGSSTAVLYGLTCTSPVKYTGHAAIKRDIDNLTAAVRATRAEEAFMTAVSPATLQILPNAHYKSAEDYTWALAEAIREEYKAIVDAGFILQIDDPALVDIYDWWFSMNDDIAGFRKWAAFQVEAVNHALEGIPEDRVRFHICWGSWHGPHKGDVPLKDIVDLLLKVKAQGYSVEAGNVRHEHEWKVWQEHQAAGRQGADPRRRQPRHQRAGASGACRRPDRAAGAGGRAGERDRWHRLRPRRPRASAARLGEAGCAGGRREAGEQGVVGVVG